jgi:hypothetical protein
MSKDNRTIVENLIDKAAKADKSEDALRFSQAACNAATALCALNLAENNTAAKDGTP